MVLSIVIPTKDRGEVFNETLRCATKAIEGIDAEIIVVNDSKTSRLKVVDNAGKLTVIDNPKSGVASARNLGARLASSNLLLFLDDDIVVSNESIRHLITFHQNTPHAALNLNWEYPPALKSQLDYTSFGRFLKSHRMTTFEGWFNDPTWQRDAVFAAHSVASFHLSLERADYERTGGYDEQFPHAGFEDYDFPLRMKKAGVKFFIDTRISVFHNEADRTQVKGWLDNQERRAATRAVAVQKGYDNLALRFSTGKKFAFALLLILFPLLLTVLRMTPNHTTLDPVYSRLLSLLQAARIYKGYSASRRK